MNNRRAQWLLAAAVALLLNGCQTPGSWKESAQREIDASLSEAGAPARAAAVPAEVSQALMPAIEIALPEGKTAPLEPRFDLAVSNGAVRQVLMGLVEGTPYDIVLQPDVTGTVTLNLKNVTVPEALKAIRDAYGYEFTREGNRFTVLGRGMQTRLFPVNYLNLVRKGKSDTRVSSGEVSQAGQSTAGGTTAAGAAGTTARYSGVQVETQTQADFWQELRGALAAIVGTEGGRKVVVNPAASLVIVRAMPEELRVVEEFLGVTHATVGRQVVLEAKILEVELNDGFQAGINWSKLGTTGSTEITASQVGGGTLLSGAGTSEIAGSSFTLDPGSGLFSSTDGTLTSAFGGMFSLAAKGTNFSVFLEALKSQGEVHVLSSPRVATVNNQKAVIKVGTDEFFVTGVTGGTTASATGVTTEPSVTLTPFFSGIALDVTPQVDAKSGIVLHIHPTVSAVTQKNKAFSVSGESFNLPLALSSIQESDSIVRASSGQIIVIGGLMKEGSTDENASVPLLGDIPLLGNLFKHRKVTRIKKELVILLKPTVIASDEEWGEAVRGSQERIKKLRIGS
jgi:MSHA biogenesis protein MshL